MEKIVYEYFLNPQNEITGWQIWPLNLKPEYSDNPLPIAGMLAGELKDAYGNYKYKLEGVVILDTTPVITQRDLAKRRIREINKKDFLKAVVRGVRDNTNTDFNNLEQDINDSENGIR